MFTWLRFWIGVVIVIDVAVIVLTWSLWGWLTDSNDSPSEVLRNAFLVLAAPPALLLAVWRSIVGGRQAAAAQQQAETAQRSLLNERYQRGAEMLGNPYRSVRQAGIYALDRLAREHPEEFHNQIVQVLCAFVRHPTNSKRAHDDDGKLRDDVQAAIGAIGSRDSAGVAFERMAELTLDLKGSDLRRAQILRADLAQSMLQHSNLSDVHFARVDLTAAYLDYADLSRAQFFEANLSESRLQSANLSGGMLQNVHMTQVSLHNANLAGANLGRANLSNGILQDTIATRVWFEHANLSNVTFLRTDLSYSILTGADLSGAEFLDANLAEAKLSQANLTGVDFSGSGSQPTRGLTQVQLDETHADPNNLPRLDGVLDAKTGQQLVWCGNSINPKN